MESDNYCEICYLPIKVDEEQVACPYCEENFHVLHLKLWLTKRESCPICKKEIISRVDETMVDIDLSESEFEDYFVNQLWKPSWIYLEDKHRAVSLQTTEDGLKVTPTNETVGRGYTHLQKRLQPGINTINVYFGYRFDQFGYFSLTGLNAKERPLWRIAIENAKVYVEYYHTQFEIEGYVAGYSKKGEGGFGIKFEPKKKGGTLVEASVILPDTPYIAESIVQNITEFIQLSFGMDADSWSRKSKLQLYKYEEYYL